MTKSDWENSSGWREKQPTKKQYKCPKCGSSEYSIHLGPRMISPNLHTERSEIRCECDDCGFEWK